MKNILWGIGLIGIGLLNGSSVFTGNPTTLDYAFDGLGVFFIGFGIFNLITNKSKGK